MQRRSLLKSSLTACVAALLSSSSRLTSAQPALPAPGTFDSNGWLTIGLAGHQPAIGGQYISTGSLYLCTAVFLPLGLPSDDPFWSATAAPWTSQRLWRGDNLPNDHAIDR